MSDGKQTDLLRQARHALELKSQKEFVTAVTECIGSGAPAIEILRLAIAARNRDLTEAARSILECLIEHKPKVSGAYSELAFLYRKDGDHARAASLLHLAVQNEPNNFRLRRELAHMLFAAGYLTEAESVMHTTNTSNEADRRALLTVQQFGTYLRRYPRTVAMQMLSEIKAQQTWLDHVACSEIIMQNIQSRKPFSLIRLGDGEGAMLRLSDDDEAEFEVLYEGNRQNRVSNWFGAKFPWKTNGFFEFSKNLVPAINKSTVIGIPDQAWLTNAYKLASPLVVPSLVNILRSCLEPQRSRIRAPLLCTSAIHRSLNFHGHLEQLIRAAGELSIVSCHVKLGDALKSAFDLSDATVYAIPGEHGSDKILDASVFVEAHYPSVFERLQAQLATPHAGRLFIIAGGFLGKLYASTVHQHGGIALDIGSQADAWMGYRTRPGHDDRLRLDQNRVG